MVKKVFILMGLFLLASVASAAGPKSGQADGTQIQGAESPMIEQEQVQRQLKTKRSEQAIEQLQQKNQQQMKEHGKKQKEILPEQPRQGKYGHSFGSGSGGKGSQGGKR